MKTITKVFVVLLVISILFVTYQSFSLEGFQEQVPECSGGANSTSAPACYATVREDYNGFADVMKEDYILKTQIVTPVCPNSPYTNWNDDALPNDKGYKYDKDDKRDGARNDFGPLDIGFNMDFNLDLSKNQTKQNEPVPNVAATNQAAYKENAPLVNNQPIPDYNLSVPKVNAPAEPASKEDKASQPSTVDSKGNDTCPPCPACKRCPEPVVECKKVVNYKQAGSDRLPVPLIADFSKF
jgi:hypothetical protein